MKKLLRNLSVTALVGVAAASVCAADYESYEAFAETDGFVLALEVERQDRVGPRVVVRWGLQRAINTTGDLCIGFHHAPWVLHS